jgi:hypothetical protein
MTQPISTRNLDRYGSAELPWSRPRDILASDTPKADLTFFVASVRPDRRPLSDCTQACRADADNDLREQDLAEMISCIRLCLDCADCLHRCRRDREPPDGLRRQRHQATTGGCVATCKSCGDECQQHALHYEHCRVCEQGLPTLRAGARSLSSRAAVTRSACARP